MQRCTWLVGPVFDHNPSLRVHLVLTILITLNVVVTSDHLKAFDRVHACVSATIDPFCFISGTPHRLLSNMSRALTSHSRLRLRGQTLHRRLLLGGDRLLVLKRCGRRGTHLHRLLNSPLHRSRRGVIARIVSAIGSPCDSRIIVSGNDIGNICRNRPIVDSGNIINRIITITGLADHILLVYSTARTLPVRILHGSVHMVTTNGNYASSLRLRRLPTGASVHINSILIASNLNNHFPRNCPITIISSMGLSARHTCAIVRTHPATKLRHLHCLLLL